MKVNTYPEQGDWREVEDDGGCWACSAAHYHVDFSTGLCGNSGGTVLVQNQAGEIRLVMHIIASVYTCQPVSKDDADRLIAENQAN